MTGRLPVSGGDATIDDLQEAEATIAARAAELELTRAAASKWQTGLTALLAIVTGLSFTSISDQMRALKSPGSWLAALALLVTFIAAVASLLQAMRAAGGLPRLVSTRALAGAAHRSAKASASSLRAAIWLTMLALLAFAVSVGILWFSPLRDTEQRSTVITSKGSWCGTIEPMKDSTLVLTQQNGQVHVIDVRDIVTWSNVDSCP